MNQKNITQKLLIQHCQKYPKLQIQDLLKYLYQSSFGCEHLLSSESSAIQYISEEYKNCSFDNQELIDRLDGTYTRVSLSYLNFGLSAETLGKLFCASAKKEDLGKENLEKRLSLTEQLIKEKNLPFDLDEYKKAVKEWQLKGYPAIHHSDTFRQNYHPAYRVISNDYVVFLPLFAKIDELLKKGTAIVAIDGGSASGKTTLGEILKKLYDCNVFHTDDFFLRPEQRTKERYAEVGGNIDRERFSDEVLIPLSQNKTVEYRKFDCSTMTVLPATKIAPKPLTIIEGAYSMHPEFENYYDLSVYLGVTPELQRERIKKRNSPQMAERFYNEWIPLEKIYFTQTKITERCDLSISVT